MERLILIRFRKFLSESMMRRMIGDLA